MTHDEVLAYLDALIPRDFRMELGPMVEACSLLGAPQNAYPTVHIGGTNGKGSTAAFLEAILRKNGYVVGMSTSPHLVDVRERIRVDGEMIGELDLARLVERLRSELPDEYYLSFFEFVTLLGFIYFKERRVDIAVIETGLGGRLDATNVVEPRVAVLTSISVDHQHHLGDTLKDITAEKCGIIKRGVPSVSALQPDEVMVEIRRWCDDVGSPLVIADPRDITTELGLAGDHQRQNAACAVETAHVLSDAGFRIERIPEALARTRWAGRLETLRREPTVLIDGAHNLAGAESLARYVSTTIPRNNAVLMLGILEGKDIAGMCRALVPLFREVVCVRAPSDRAASPKDLAANARAFGAKVEIADDVAEAMNGLMSTLKPTDTLVVSGSLHTVGAVRNMFTKPE